MRHILRLHENNDFEYLCIDENNQVTSQQKAHSIDQLDLDPNGPFIILLPGTKITMHQVQLPKLTPQELALAVPNMLEDKLSSSVNNCHFTIGTPNKDNYRAIAVTDKIFWDKTLALLKEYDIQAQVIIPDYLALNYTYNQWTIHSANNMTLVKTDKCHGFSIETNMIDIMLSNILKSSLLMPNKIIDTSDKSSKPSLIHTDIAVDHTPQKIMANKIDFNMLNQRIKIKNKHNKTKLTPWQKCAITAVCLLAIFFVGQGALLINYSIQNKQLTQRALNLFKQVNPDATNLDNAKSLTTHLIRQYQRQPNSFLILLQIITSQLKKYPAISVNSLNYTNGALTINLSSSDKSELDTFTTSISKQNIKIKSNSTTTDDQIIKITLTLESTK